MEASNNTHSHRIVMSLGGALVGQSVCFSLVRKRLWELPVALITRVNKAYNIVLIVIFNSS